MNTIDTATPGADVLVWVRGAGKDRKSGAWKMGRCVGGDGFPPELKADGYNGDWEIPFWHPLPPPAEEASG